MKPRGESLLIPSKYFHPFQFPKREELGFGIHPGGNVLLPLKKGGGEGFPGKLFPHPQIAIPFP
jgi:hypothetical protein